MFIVIEGLDGAGKSTQVAKIQELLISSGLSYEYLHFPRFTAPFYGELVARFLRGDLGAVDHVDPYLVAVIYAGDRHDAAKQIRAWIDEGKVVIVDRYVLSNIAYQCAKIQDPEQKTRLKNWILDFEYNHNQIPQPDLTLFLDVPFRFTTKKLSEERQGDDRDYLQGKRDIHEASLDLQQSVRQIYMSHQDNKYKIIDCSSAQGEMLDADAIFKKIEHEIKPLL